MIYLGSTEIFAAVFPRAATNTISSADSDLSCRVYFPLQFNTTDDFMKTFLATWEISQFFAQNAEVCAAKKLTLDICRKILIRQSYQAKPEF